MIELRTPKSRKPVCGKRRVSLKQKKEFKDDAGGRS